MSDSELKISDLLEAIPKNHADDRIPFGVLAKDLHEQGLPLLMAFFAIPMCIPIPYPPGFSTLVAITISLFSLQMLVRRTEVWLPGIVAKRGMPRSILIKMLDKSLPTVRWMEKRFKERWFFLTNAKSEVWVAIISLVMNFVISIPLPGIHFFPGWAIMIMCMGLLNRDGKVVAIGIATSVFAVFFAVGEILLGKTLIMAIAHYFGQL